MENFPITREEVIQRLNEVFPDPSPMLEDECNYTCPQCGHVIRIPKHTLDVMCKMVPNTNPITQMPMIRCVTCNHDDPRWFIHIRPLNAKRIVMINVTPKTIKENDDEDGLEET